MDLIDYHTTYGAAALNAVAERAGLKPNYIKQLTGCHKSVSLPVAEALHKAEPKLDILSMMRMRQKFKAPAPKPKRRQSAKAIA